MFLYMERTITPEERIRRAEEIYTKRKQLSGIRVSSNNVNRNEKKKISLFKKMFMQLAICAVIYIIFYLIKNTNYIFSDNVITKTKEFLSYDINFGSLQSNLTSFWNDNKDKFNLFESDGSNNVENTNTLNETINQITNEVINEITNTVTNEIAQNIENKNTNVVGGIGGAVTNELVEQEVAKSESKEEKSNENKSQYEIDVEYLKGKYSFIMPVTGTITSRYGKREATEVVSANHQGLDIGANEGTPIYASMEGKVVVSSEEGEYGKHIDIVNGDVLTRYAHCSKLLVKEGEKVKQGDKIAEVGSTGNSTGPHLHFEIRRDDRTINPESILDFD